METKNDTEYMKEIKQYIESNFYVRESYLIFEDYNKINPYKIYKIINGDLNDKYDNEYEYFF